MNEGYHKIPHKISQWHLKTLHKYLYKNKASIADIWLELCNDFQMCNQVSYGYYSKRWNWHKRDIKELLMHIGLHIPTSKNQYSTKKLSIITAIKSKKYPENCIGIFQNIFGTPNGTALEHQMEQQNKVNTNTCNIFGTPNGTALEHQMDNNKIEEIIEENNNKKNMSVLDKTDLNYITTNFELWWKTYNYMRKKLEQENIELKVGSGKKKKSFNYYKQLIKKYKPEDILIVTKGYLAERYRSNIKPRSNEYFLKKELLVDFESLKEEYYEIGKKVKIKEG